MKLMDEIEGEIKKVHVPKWKKLKEEISEEIYKMIESGFTIDRQIELILKHGVVEKLDRKEYINIIKKHFGYVGKNSKISKKIPTKTPKSTSLLEPTMNLSIEEKLSKEVNLMDSFLAKKAR